MKTISYSPRVSRELRARAQKIAHQRKMSAHRRLIRAEHALPLQRLVQLFTAREFPLDSLQRCPICGNPNKFRIYIDDGRQTFHCEKCGIGYPQEFIERKLNLVPVDARDFYIRFSEGESAINSYQRKNTPICKIAGELRKAVEIAIEGADAFLTVCGALALLRKNRNRLPAIGFNNFDNLCRRILEMDSRIIAEAIDRANAATDSPSLHQ